MRRIDAPLPIAIFLLPMSTSSVYPVRNGFAAMCGKCLRSSMTVDVDTTDAAWTALQALGWSPYNDYALCPACTKAPPNVDADAAAAMRRRKRR